MKRRLYAIRDSKMNEYNNPSVMASDAAAIRAFGDLVTKDKDTLVSNHPADFSIWYIGDFDFVSGELEVCKPLLLATGTDYIKE